MCGNEKIVCDKSSTTRNKTMDVKKPRVISYERGDRSSGPENIEQKEYLSKLTLRRDAMVEQERMRLAQALTRLGIQSSLNKDQSFRLRMYGSDIPSSLSPLERTSMTTTAENFRHKRQLQQKQQHQLLLATLLPLEGRQIFHRNLATSGGKNIPYSNDSRIEAGVIGVFDKSASSLAQSQTEKITHKKKTRSTKASTKELGNISLNVLPQQQYLESKYSHMIKGRPRVKQAVRQIASSLPPVHNLTVVSSQPPVHNLTVVSSQPPVHNLTVVSSQPPVHNLTVVSSQPPVHNLTVVSSQPPIHYSPVMSQDSVQNYWHPGVTALDSQAPDTRISKPTETRRIITHRVKHPVEDTTYDNDILQKGLQEEIHKGGIDKPRHTRSSFALQSTPEHPELQLTCSKCIALEKKKMSNRMISNSASDFYEKRPTFLQKKNSPRSMKSEGLQNLLRTPQVASDQPPKIFIKKHTTRNTNDYENQNLIVTSLPDISQHQNFSQRFTKDSIKRLHGAERSRNGFKPHTNLAVDVGRTLETSNVRVLDPGTETDRSRPRKINIVIDMPDTQLGSTTPDLDVSYNEETDDPTAVVT